MAFSATITGQSYFGPGHRSIRGTWTGSAGDAAGTMTVAGIVQEVVFQKFDAKDNTYQIIPRVERSTTAGITTLTIENQDNVTDGFFTIDILGQ